MQDLRDEIYVISESNFPQVWASSRMALTIRVLREESISWARAPRAFSEKVGETFRRAPLI